MLNSCLKHVLAALLFYQGVVANETSTKPDGQVVECMLAPKCQTAPGCGTSTYSTCMNIPGTKTVTATAAPSTSTSPPPKKSYTPPEISAEHLHDVLDPVMALFDNDKDQYSPYSRAFSDLFTVIWTFVHLSRGCVTNWMLAKEGDWTGTVPDGVIPVLSFGTNPKDIEAKAVAAVKSEMKAVKGLLGVDEGKKMELGDHWWPWALAEGVISGGWQPQPDNRTDSAGDSMMLEAILALLGVEAEIVPGGDNEHYWNEYLVRADVSPFWIKLKESPVGDVWMAAVIKDKPEERKLTYGLIGTGDDQNPLTKTLAFDELGDISELMQLKTLYGRQEDDYRAGKRPGGDVKAPLTFDSPSK